MGKRKRKINFRKIKWGRLTEWLKRHEKAITRAVGKPFKKDGTMNERVLRKLAKNTKLLQKLAGTHWKHVRRMIMFRLNVLKRR